MSPGTPIQVRYKLFFCDYGVVVTANGAVGLGFDFRACQSYDSVAIGSSPLLCFFKAALPRR